MPEVSDSLGPWTGNRVPMLWIGDVNEQNTFDAGGITY